MIKREGIALKATELEKFLFFLISHSLALQYAFSSSFCSKFEMVLIFFPHFNNPICRIQFLWIRNSLYNSCVSLLFTQSCKSFILFDPFNHWNKISYIESMVLDYPKCFDYLHKEILSYRSDNRFCGYHLFFHHQSNDTWAWTQFTYYRCF